MNTTLPPTITRPTFPLEYRAEAQAAQGLEGSWEAGSSGRTITCAVPTEFGGSGQGLSPEDLFAQAIVNCFLGSVKVFALASKVSFQEMRAEAVLTLEKSESGQPFMRRCQLIVVVKGAERPDRMEIIARKALKTGFILNSVRTEIDLSLRMEAGPT